MTQRSILLRFASAVAVGRLFRALVSSAVDVCFFQGFPGFSGDENQQGSVKSADEAPDWAPWSNFQYRLMRDDKARTSSYFTAIESSVAGKTVLDLGTGALALLALHCARSGAKKVYAIERNPKAAEMAANTVKGAGLDDKITVISGASQTLELPEQVDVVVHELFGDIASREGVAPALRDARRYVKPEALQAGGWSVPVRGATWMMPVQLPASSYFEADDVRMDALMEASDALRAWENGEKDARAPLLRLQQFPMEQCRLAAPQLLEELVFGQPGADDAVSLETQKRSQKFFVTRAAPLAGLALYISIDCGGGAPAVSSGDPGSHWANCVVLAAPRVVVEPGDILEVESVVELEGENPRYHLKATVRWRGRDDDPGVVVLDTSFQ
eukprot:TRINITY_DN48736_c0_g1_i1.p1 TRINITY_DN48736_c0_g1~~TRINITY_DN48736_c0_g1_i1.p1  ORF type:complete len:386 (+),score=99.68 TRINITY_DN48736_c0_g1_i1:222-1379(+)